MTLNAGHHLLRDALFSARQHGSREGVHLAEILANLGAGEDLEFPALRPHQSHPWHAFLVQLGALVAARSGSTDLDRPAEAWREALLDLAGDAGEDAWTLVVEDTSRPAFLQVAVPKGEWGRYKPAADTPDELDMLVTAKNHDVKHHLMRSARPEHWVYALVTLQTFQGFSGRGNYGIARMNSGFGSRPGLATTPGLSWGERFRRDVKVWLEERKRLLGADFDYDSAGHTLLWTFDWDGKKPRLPFERCDPFFIEVCRRVRLRGEGDSLVAYGAPSDKAFLDAKDRKGNTGDIWTPVDAVNTALTISPSGLTYQKLQDVLFSGNWPRRPALRLRKEDGKHPEIIAQVLVRGQGKTEGYHERRIPIPPKSRPWLFDAQTRETLGDFSKARVERAADVQRRVLRPALCSLLQGGPDDLDLRDDRPQHWVDRFDRAVDAVFFDDLWRDFELSSNDADAAHAHWDRRLYELAKDQFDDAKRSAPVPEARSYRAVAMAEMLFEGSARKLLKKHFVPRTDPNSTLEGNAI